MPLLDHFHPPLSVDRPWEGFHSTWPAVIATQLNRDLLPPDYVALPQVTVGVRVEADIATSPPHPSLSAAVDFLGLKSFEVQILQEMGGRKLRGVIELVSPANKDRPSHRQAFAVKCAGYLQQGISVIVIDVVTNRLANLHAQLMEVLQHPPGLAWQSATDLSAIAYRAVPREDGDRLDVWAETLSVGAGLPAMPLWLDVDLCLAVPFEETYLTTCDSLRYPS